MIELSDKTNGIVLDSIRDIKESYTKLFKTLPSVHVKKYSIKTFPDYLHIDYDKISKHYGEPLSIIKTSKDKNISDDFCNNQSDIEKVASEYSEEYFIIDRLSMSSIIICQKLEIIIVIDASELKIGMFYNYDSTPDICKIFDEFESMLPLPREISSDATVSMIAYSNDYYTIDSKINKVDIDLKENYNDDFEEVSEKVDEFIKSKTRKTGLVLFNGEPGTGKTMYIRSLISKYASDKNFMIITPDMATRLADPAMIGFLQRNADSIFILEDCEEVTKKRGKTSFGSAVATLLNMSDGLMSDIFNAKFICTFNADETEIDSAILRPGRCVAKYTFKKLCKEKTEALKKKFNIEDDKEEMTLAEIYNHSDIVKPDENEKSKQKIGF